MKYLFINSVCGIGSTGRICVELANQLSSEGNECKIAFGRIAEVPESASEYAVRIGSRVDVRLHALRSRILDDSGFGSRLATNRFLKWADEYNPDVLWLHNIHGYYINIEILFEWIKSRPDMIVKWTLHDCWPFTGHCTYFTAVHCDKWKNHCIQCAQKKEYPASYFIDNSYSNFEKKKQLFTGVRNLTLITPSYWLANLVKESFLGGYPVEVHHNTIDYSIFRPTKSNFKEEHGISDKKMILGVSSEWPERKGLKDFIKLSALLNDRYVIVLVGTTKKQEQNLPKNIIGIRRTNSKRELAEIYSAADVFFNPTYEDNYPTVNLEAQACGTPCFTYNTGGSPESVPDENVYLVGDIEAVAEGINRYISNNSALLSARTSID